MTDQAPSLLPEVQTPPEVQTFLPQPDDVPAARVPRNVEEVAAQVALAIEDTRPFKDKLAQNVTAIKANGTTPLLSQVLSQHFEDNVRAARAQAEAFAAAGETERTGFAAQVLATNEADKTLKNPVDNPVEAQDALAQRALEGVSANTDTTKLYRDTIAFTGILDKAAGAIATRNMIAQAAGEESDKAHLWDYISQFGRSLIPYWDTLSITNAISKQTGTNRYLDKYAAVTDLRYMLSGMHPSERQRVMGDLVKDLADNPAVKADVLRQVLELSKSDANLDFALDAMQATDVYALVKGLGSLARKGVPLKAVKDVVGETEAGKVAAADLINQTKLSGLNDAELVSRVIASGGNPFTADPAALRGMNAAAQKELVDGWNKMLDNFRERLSSSGMTPEEIKDAAAKIRQSYAPSNNPHVADVIFGEASADGQQMTVFWQSKQGRAFMSREAAEQWAKEQGLTNFEIVPKNIIDDVQPQVAYHGGTTTGKLDDSFIGSGQGGSALGKGFYMSKAEGLADTFAQKYGHTVSKWSIPEDNKFLHWYETSQPAEVAKAASKVLGKDVAGMTGEDIYRAAVKKLGSEEKAAAALRKEGVVGNYASHSGPHGTGPEHMLFSGKDAKFKGARAVENKAGTVVEEAPVEIDGEVFFNKLDGAESAATPIERKLIDNQVRNQSTAQTPFSRGEPMFIGRNLEMGDQLHPKIRGLVGDWLNLLRFGKQRMAIVSSNELPYMLKRLNANIDDYNRMMSYVRSGSNNGFYTRVNSTVGKFHLIVWDASLSGSFRKQVSTLAHEIGHAFEKEVLLAAPQQIRQDLFNEFKNWYKARMNSDITWDQFKTLFRVPVDDELRKGFPAPAFDFPAREATSLGLDTSWYRSAGEFWAENFAKFMLTDARPVSALEKWFAQHAQKLKEFFVQVARALGVDVSKPNDYVRDLMKSYLDNPREWDALVAAKQSDTIGSEVAFKKKDSIPMSQAIEKEIRKVQGQLLKDGLSDAEREALLKRIELLRSSLAPPTPTAPGPTGEWLVKQVRNDPLSYDSIGKFSQQDIDSMATVAIDPKHAASEQAVEARVVGVHAEAKTRHALQSFIDPYFKGLGKEGTRKVQALLEEGDAMSNAGGLGKEFNFSEAMAKGLNEREAQAYLATRQLRMMMYHIRNGEMVKHLRSMGLKEVEVNGIKAAGKDLSMVEASVLKNKQLYDVATKTMVDWDSPAAMKAYGEGKRVVQLAHPTEIDGELRRVMLVDESAKTRDIVTALSYRPGEYSRIYTDEYFITMKRVGKVDGINEEITSTIRTAKSVREAQEFVDNVTRAVGVLKNIGAAGARDRELEKLVGRYFSIDDFKAAFDKGDFDGLSKLDYHFTRNKEEYLNGSVGEALANGRLFTSKRSERLFSVDASRPNTLGVFESIEAEVTNVSRVSNINQWREQMVRRWMNTFGDMIPNRTGNDINDFYSATGASFTKATPEAMFAERTHKYIMRQIGLKTGEERYYQTMTRRMTEKWFTGNETVETAGAAVRKMGLLGFIRNINFNLTLGMFNPAQLIVQANGAATAMILSPLHGLAAAKTFPLLRMALMSDNPSVWNFFGNVEKGLFGSKEEFVKLVKAVRQTGIVDNLKSTALYNLEDGKLNIFGGYPARVLGQNTFFFNRGEEFSRLVSFDVARREWMAANKGAEWSTKEALAQIVVRMDDLTQNMTRANLARFQEGAASIPLQFAQYNIKLGANIMASLLGHGGRSFSRVEALQLLVGHVILYGAAGNGLAWLVDEMISDDAKSKMTVDQKAYLGQGLLAGLLNQFGEWMTGKPLNLALGSRLGSFNYYQQVADAIFTDPKNVFEALGGPSVATAKRLGVIGDVASLFYRDPDKTAKDVMEGLSRMTTEQVTTLRNVTKAYLYMQYQNKMIDGKGLAVAQLTPMEVLGQALGFQPTAAIDVSNLIKGKKEHNEALDDIASTIVKVQKDIITARMRGDNAYADEQHKLLDVLWPENTGDLMDVKRRIREKLYPYDNQMQKLLGEYIWKGQTYKQPLVVTQPKKED